MANDIVGLIGAIATVVAMSAFVGVVAWSWSSRRKQAFDALARVPLEDDAGTDAAGGPQ